MSVVINEKRRSLLQAASSVGLLMGSGLTSEVYRSMGVLMPRNTSAQAVSPVFSRIHNRLLISGHTDGTAFNSSQYSNWELSGDRALQARQVLAGGGMPVQRVAQVSAFAETMLLNPVQPGASDNRRIEILILTGKAEQQLREMFAPENKNNALEQAAEAARQNAPVLRTQS